MSRLQGLFFALATVALVVLATFYFTKDWIPPLKSDRVAVDTALWWSLLVTGVVFILTNLLLAYFAWRYQDKEGARAAYWHDNVKLEWAWTAATAVIMFAFMFNALGLWADINKEAPANAMQIEVTGQQFRWIIRYPGRDGAFGKTDIRLVNNDNVKGYIGVDPNDPASADDLVVERELFLPLDRPVQIRLRSTDVIHSLFLPNFRVKQDAVPGMTVSTWFVPKARGDYEIACAEHCGLGHYRMKGVVHVVPAEELDKAVAEFAQ